jgi:hypothetical protein
MSGVFRLLGAKILVFIKYYLAIKCMKNYTDKQLYDLCVQYGLKVLRARRSFLGLLPEVLRRRLYEKKGFVSIYEFAAKLAGLSREQVQRVLQLERRFDSLPALRGALVSGEVSVGKLARVACIANSENENELLNKAKILPQNVLETFVRDYRTTAKMITENISEQNLKEEGGKEACKYHNGLFETFPDADSVRTHRISDEKVVEKSSNEGVFFGNEGAMPGTENMLPAAKLIEIFSKLNFNEETLNKLLGLREKGFDLNALIGGLLEKREEEIAVLKEKIGVEMGGERDAEVGGELGNVRMVRSAGNKSSRYIPVKVRNILYQEFGTKCSIKDCKKCATNLHHMSRFAVAGVHDPRFMAPLCEEHHAFAHLADVKFAEKYCGRR